MTYIMEELRHFAKNDAGEPRCVVGTIITTFIVVTNIVIVIVRFTLATIIVVAIKIIVAIMRAPIHILNMRARRQAYICGHMY